MSTVALHHEMFGPEDAPPLLLGGSLGTNLTMWEPQLRVLSQHFRVIAFDLRGHGRSAAPPGPYSMADLGRDVVALLDALGLERASYCGLSIGGMAGIWLGANAPARVDRLVLMCTSAYAVPRFRGTERAAAVRAAGTPATVADGVVAGWFTPAWAEQHPREMAGFKAMLGATDAEGYAACCEAIVAMDLRDALPQVTAPTLVISAADDLALPPDHQRVIAAAVPDARLEVVDDAAHLASVQQAERVNALIIEHMGA